MRGSQRRRPILRPGSTSTTWRPRWSTSWSAAIPHVFGVDGSDQPVEESPVDAEDQQRRWDELKRTERGRSDALAGVAMAAPAVALAGKLGARSAKFGVDIPLPDGDDIPEQIFRLAFELGRRGEDPEIAVRAVAHRHAAAMAAEQVVRQVDERDG